MDIKNSSVIDFFNSESLREILKLEGLSTI